MAYRLISDTQKLGTLLIQSSPTSQSCGGFKQHPPDRFSTSADATHRGYSRTGQPTSERKKALERLGKKALDRLGKQIG